MSLKGTSIFSHSPTPVISFHPAAEKLAAEAHTVFTAAKDRLQLINQYRPLLSVIFEEVPLLTISAASHNMTIPGAFSKAFFSKQAPTLYITFTDIRYALFSSSHRSLHPAKFATIFSPFPIIKRHNLIPSHYVFSTIVSNIIQPLHNIFDYRFKGEISSYYSTTEKDMAFFASATEKSNLNLHIRFDAAYHCKLIKVIKEVLVPDPNCMKEQVS